MSKAAYWIEKLNLSPHPEGGFFKETYRSAEKHLFDMNGNKKERNYCTAIYFLMETHNFSAFHKIQSDELWHFYAGDALDIFYIDKKGELKTIVLGNNLERGETPQACVPANVWFGSRPSSGSQFSLVGCTVSPGFDFNDFELANRKDLSLIYPKHSKIIHELTRE